MRTPESPYATWVGHIVLCGLHGVGLRTVEHLTTAGHRVVVVEDRPERRLRAALDAWHVPLLDADPRSADALLAAGLAGAKAVVCVEESDLARLETALVVRELRPDVRVVVQLANPAVGRALQALTGPGSVLDTAALAAPSVLEACLGSGRHMLDLEGTSFVVATTTVEQEGTLRSVFGDRAPIGVAPADGGPLVVCPGRDHVVGPGDRVTVVEARATVPEPPVRRSRHRARELRRMVVGLAHEVDRPLQYALSAFALLIVLSTVVVHLGYQRSGGGGLTFLESLYFTLTTAATVGYGDFSFAGQPTWLLAFGTADLFVGAALAATVFALSTNLLVSRRIASAFGLQRTTGMTGHVVIVGLGSVGIRVVEGLVARGKEVVVVERDEDNRHLVQARALGAAVVIADATLRTTLDLVNLHAAIALAALTSDDLTNIETGLAVREYLGASWERVPVVLRVFDRPLAQTVEAGFGFRHVLSASVLAAPWFVGGALGLDVLDTFYVERTPFLLARLTVTEGSGLDGLAMQELSARTRVVALHRAGRELEHPPRRGTRFAGGDVAYLVGPYEELLAVLQREQAAVAAESPHGSERVVPAAQGGSPADSA